MSEKKVLNCRRNHVFNSILILPIANVRYDAVVTADIFLSMESDNIQWLEVWLNMMVLLVRPIYLISPFLKQY